MLPALTVSAANEATCVCCSPGARVVVVHKEKKSFLDKIRACCCCFPCCRKDPEDEDERRYVKVDRELLEYHLMATLGEAGTHEVLRQHEEHLRDERRGAYVMTEEAYKTLQVTQKERVFGRFQDEYARIRRNSLGRHPQFHRERRRRSIIELDFSQGGAGSTPPKLHIRDLVLQLSGKTSTPLTSEQIVQLVLKQLKKERLKSTPEEIEQSIREIYAAESPDQLTEQQERVLRAIIAVQHRI